MDSLAPYIDIHTHHSAKQEDVQAVHSLMAGHVEGHQPGSFVSLGIHPWQLRDSGPELLKRLMQHDLGLTKPVAIGEAGFDLRIGVSLEHQMELVVWQEELAAGMGLPMVYHNVGANHLVLARVKALPQLVRIIHGFAGNALAARQLLAAGCYLSFGSALFDERRHASESLRQTPTDRLFLETDNSTRSIQEVYDRAADILKMDTASLRKRIFANFVHIFKALHESS